MYFFVTLCLGSPVHVQGGDFSKFSWTTWCDRVGFPAIGCSIIFFSTTFYTLFLGHSEFLLFYIWYSLFNVIGLGVIWKVPQVLHFILFTQHMLWCRMKILKYAIYWLSAITILKLEGWYDGPHISIEDHYLQPID